MIDRELRIQARHIARLEAMVEKLLDVMDRQTDAIGKLVAIAMTPEHGDDVAEIPESRRYLDPADHDPA